jgi:hypothetical protein
MPGETRVGFVTTYDPARAEMGGAAWVDTRTLGALSFRSNVQRMLVSDLREAEPVALEVRRDFRLAVQTLLRMIGRGEPYQVAKFRRSSQWQARADQLRALRANVDVLVTSQWPALLLASDAGVEIDVHLAHNVDYLLAEKYDPPLFRLMGNAVRMRRVEQELIGRPTCVVAISRNDAQRIAMTGRAARHVRLIDGEAPTAIRSRRAIGFIGKGTWPPNAEALDTLVEEVMPLVRRRLQGDAPRLVVAGRDTERWRGAGILNLGAVDDVGQFYDNIDLVVVPRSGLTTGVSVKLLEAIERGVAAIAPRQLAVDAGVHGSCATADSPEDIAEQILTFYAAREPGTVEGHGGGTGPDESVTLSQLIDQIVREVEAR